jgi:NADH-quinone oxidoreductase subunit M
VILQLWNTLLDNIVFMLVMLPVVGAGLVFASSRLGKAAARQTALANSVTTGLLSILMVMHFEVAPGQLPPEAVRIQQKSPPIVPDESSDSRPAASPRSAAATPPPFQMVTVVPWLGEARPPAVEKPPGSGAGSSASSTVSGPNVRFAVGVDGISLWFIALAAAVTVTAILSSSQETEQKSPAYYAFLLLLEAGLIGQFAALDLVLFYVFYEFSLIPLLLLIGLWGGYERQAVARKFFIFNLAGSFLVLFGLIAVAFSYPLMKAAVAPYELTFSISRLTTEIPLLALSDGASSILWRQASPWIFLALLLGFAVKIPLFPFHTWAPRINVEAPTDVSMLFSGVVLKMGCYGFLRFIVPLFPQICISSSGLLTTIAVAGLIYFALLTLAQDDVKKLAIYACLSKTGLCVIGILSLNGIGVTGALLELIGGGLSIAAVMLLIGRLDRRYQTRDIEAFGGLAKRYPRMAYCFLFAALAIVGMPGLSGFPGELLTLFGVVQGAPLTGTNLPAAVGCLAGSLLVAWALFWMMQRVFYGRLREPVFGRHLTGGLAGPLAETHNSPTSNPPNLSDVSQDDSRSPVERASDNPLSKAALPRGGERGDLTRYELTAFLPLAAIIVWMGLCPGFFISRMEPSVARLLRVYVAASEGVEARRDAAK